MGKIDSLVMRIAAMLIAAVVLLGVHWLLPDRPIAVAIMVFCLLWMAFSFAVVLTLASLVVASVPDETSPGQKILNKIDRHRPLYREVKTRLGEGLRSNNGCEVSKQHVSQ